MCWSTSSHVARSLVISEDVPVLLVFLPLFMLHVLARFLTIQEGYLARFLTVQEGYLARFLTVQEGYLARFLTVQEGYLARFLTVQEGYLARFLTIQEGYLDSVHNCTIDHMRWGQLGVSRCTLQSVSQSVSQSHLHTSIVWGSFTLASISMYISYHSVAKCYLTSPLPPPPPHTHSGTVHQMFYWDQQYMQITSICGECVRY